MKKKKIENKASKCKKKKVLGAVGIQRKPYTVGPDSSPH